jgi:hypothetical protein
MRRRLRCCDMSLDEMCPRLETELLEERPHGAQ